MLTGHSYTQNKRETPPYLLRNGKCTSIVGLNPEETNNTTKSDHSRRLPHTHLCWTRLFAWNQTTCDTLLSFVRVGNLKGWFTQNSTSSMTQCGRRGRRSLVRSTVKGLNALRTASVAPSQPRDDLSAQFVPMQQGIYGISTAAQSYGRAPLGCFWLLFYSKVMDLWAIVAEEKIKSVAYL